MEINYKDYRYRFVDFIENDLERDRYRQVNRHSYLQNLRPLPSMETLLSTPTVHGFYSLTGPERTFSIDCKQLKYYNSKCPRVNTHMDMDLNHQIGNTVRREGAKTPNMLLYLKEAKNDFPDVFGTGRINLSEARILSHRGLLRSISRLPYSSSDDFIIYCCLYKGVIFTTLHAKNTVVRQTFSDWGHKFEQYVLADTPSSFPNTSNSVNQNEKFFCVLRATLGNHNLIYHSETDGLLVEDEMMLHNLSDVNTTRSKIIDILNSSKFVELKTKNIRLNRSIFRQEKSLDWWLHSMYGKNDFVISGERNEKGIIGWLSRYDITSLQNDYGDFWNPAVCVSFCDSFFTYMKDCFKVELDKHRLFNGDIRRNMPKIELMFEKTPTSIRLCKDYDHTINLIPDWLEDSFDQYYSGEKVAPVLTIFIGGNHEASNHMQELPYGGWAAPNIYYLGYAGVVNVGGIRIAGMSGIYKAHDYLKGHFEISPYSDNTMRSVYHVRQVDVFRLKQLSGEVTIGLSHDWPRNAAENGNVERLLSNKPFFRDEVEDGKLGSPPAEDVLLTLKPKFWFAGHLHCYYPALITHEKSETYTKFLALDKCLPRRKFLQVLSIPHDDSSTVELKYDLEWLTILHLTNHLLSVKPVNGYMPSETGNERYNFTPTDAEKEAVLKMMDGDLVIPKNFAKFVEAFDPSTPNKVHRQPTAILNSQTIQLCEQLQIDDPVSLILLQSGNPLPSPSPLKDDSAVSSEQTDISTGSNIFSPSPLSLPMPRFSLPDPQNSHEEISLTDDEDNLPNNSTDTNQSSDSMFVNTSIGDSSDSTSLVCSTPVTGKRLFKRRNESLYSNSGDE